MRRQQHCARRLLSQVFVICVVVVCVVFVVRNVVLVGLQESAARLQAGKPGSATNCEVSAIAAVSGWTS